MSLFEVNRVLKPTGVLRLITSNDRWEQLENYINLGEAQIKELLKVTGFGIEELDASQDGTFWIISARKVSK